MNYKLSLYTTDKRELQEKCEISSNRVSNDWGPIIKEVEKTRLLTCSEFEENVSKVFIYKYKLNFSVQIFQYWWRTETY